MLCFFSLFTVKPSMTGGSPVFTEYILTSKTNL